MVANSPRRRSTRNKSNRQEQEGRHRRGANSNFGPSTRKGSQGAPETSKGNLQQLLVLWQEGRQRAIVRNSALIQTKPDQAGEMQKGVKDCTTQKAHGELEQS